MQRDRTQKDMLEELINLQRANTERLSEILELQKISFRGSVDYRNQNKKYKYIDNISDDVRVKESSKSMDYRKRLLDDEIRELMEVIQKSRDEK